MFLMGGLPSRGRHVSKWMDSIDLWQRLCNGRPQPMTADRCDVAVPTALQSARPQQSAVLGDAKVASQPSTLRRDANIETAHPRERNAIGNEITN